MKKKGKFLTFMFSLMPGAGHMYLGFMKQGISIMFCFFAFIIFSAFTGIEVLLFFLPIVWFYGFFDAINKNSLTDEEFYTLEDQYLFNINLDDIQKIHLGKFRVYIAAILIFIGASMLLSNFMDLASYLLPEYIYSGLSTIVDQLPQFIIGIAIILIGIKLIRGKNAELKKEEQNLLIMNEEMNENENS
jgi:hypothetical protein